MTLANLCGVWVRKSLDGTIDDDIAAKLAIGEGRQDDLEAERLELQAMNSERFQHRFLERSRPWVLQHLRELLTPRTLHMPGADGRPNIEYIRDVYYKLMGLDEGHRRDGDDSNISSDDSNEDNLVAQRNWSNAPLKEGPKKILKWWVERARKRRQRWKLVKGIIDASVKEECEDCGRTMNSGVTFTAKLVHPEHGKEDPRAIELLMDAYDETYGEAAFDATVWKSYFRTHAKIRTFCSECLNALARAKEPTLIVSHQAVLRMIYCYLTGRPREDAPSLEMNLNTVIKLTLTSTGCEEERFKLLEEDGSKDAPSH